VQGFRAKGIPRRCSLAAVLSLRESISDNDSGLATIYDDFISVISPEVHWMRKGKRAIVTMSEDPNQWRLYDRSCSILVDHQLGLLEGPVFAAGALAGKQAAASERLLKMLIECRSWNTFVEHKSKNAARHKVCK